MSRFYNLEQAPFNNRASARSIVASNNGLIYNIQDLSTLFQDAAGTIPVTAVGQPVGLWLDKSQGLELGNELVTNGAFNTDLSGWTQGANVTTTQINGAASMARKGAVNSDLAFRKTIALTLGKTYKLIFNASVSSCAVKVSNSSPSVGPMAAGTGTLSYIFTAKSNTAIISFWPTNDLTTTVIDNISVREIKGNHATQSITASRPTLIYENGLYGLSFDGIDDYLNLPYMGLYANGSASIVAARDALSQTADTYVISERSTSNVNPKYFPSRQSANAGNMDSYIVNDAAAVVVDTVGSAYGGASNAVIRSVVDSGNNIKLFKNGALAANDNYTRSGTLTLTNTTIGASVSTATSNYSNMKLYSLCIAKSALSDSERRRVERLLAYNSGAQI